MPDSDNSRRQTSTGRRRPFFSRQSEIGRAGCDFQAPRLLYKQALRHLVVFVTVLALIELGSVLIA